MQRYLNQNRVQCPKECLSLYKYFSSSTTNASSSGTTSSSFASLQEQYRKDILNSSLHHVHQHGWTDDAIAFGVLSHSNGTLKKYPPSFIGMMNDNHSKSSDLIHYFMKDCNLKLKSHLDEKRKLANSWVRKTHAEKLKYCIQYRLEMVIPFVQSRRWSEGMALGATPYNAMSTATHLEEIVDMIEDELLADKNRNHQRLTLLERTAIGAVYVATELHLLADTSPAYKDTWVFLNDRINELDMIQKNKSIPHFNQDTIVAGVAVASSLGGAVLSLMTPVARNGLNAIAGTFVPQVMNLMSMVPTSNNTPPSGSMAKDYDISDLPPIDPIDVKDNELNK